MSSHTVGSTLRKTPFTWHTVARSIVILRKLIIAALRDRLKGDVRLVVHVEFKMSAYSSYAEVQKLEVGHTILIRANKSEAGHHETLMYKNTYCYI